MSRAPLEHELAAVRILAGQLGLGHCEPRVLKLAEHTMLRLAPAPIVARVHSGGDLARRLAFMAREASLAQHLARLGAPAVRPSTDPPPGPYEVEGCAISLWTFVEHRPAEVADAGAAGAALRELHAAMASYEGELPSCRDAIVRCAELAEDGAQMAAARPEDRALIARSVRRGLARLPDDPAKTRPLHGDTHLGNVMITPHGPIWGDLEAACRGPLEWDLTNKPAAFLASFEGIDGRLLAELSALRRACVAVWCWTDVERSAEIREAAELHTAWLRRRARLA